MRGPKYWNVLNNTYVVRGVHRRNHEVIGGLTFHLNEIRLATKQQIVTGNTYGGVAKWFQYLLWNCTPKVNMSPKYVQITKKQRRQNVRRLAALGANKSSESKMVLRNGPKRQCKITFGRRLRRPVSWDATTSSENVQK